MPQGKQEGVSAWGGYTWCKGLAPPAGCFAQHQRMPPREARPPLGIGN